MRQNKITREEEEKIINEFELENTKNANSNNNQQNKLNCDLVLNALEKIKIIFNDHYLNKTLKLTVIFGTVYFIQYGIIYALPMILIQINKEHKIQRND